MAEELYLTSSTGEELQFCFMRPSAEELCPELPFMIAGVPITLDSFGVSARLLSVDDLPPLPPISDDAPPSSTRPLTPLCMLTPAGPEPVPPESGTRGGGDIADALEIIGGAFIG